MTRGTWLTECQVGITLCQLRLTCSHQRCPSFNRSRPGTPDRPQHLLMDWPPVLIEVDRPGLDAKSLEADLGRQRFLADLWVEQNARAGRGESATRSVVLVLASVRQQFRTRLAFDDPVADTGNPLWIGDRLQQLRQPLGRLRPEL